MLYMTPSLEEHRDALRELESLRRRLGEEVSRATPWAGRLRREACVAAVRSYQPDRAASAWIEFCIEAHLTLAHERLETLHRAAHQWAQIEALVGGRGWPDRLAIALEQCLFDGADRAAYCSEPSVSPATASADFRRIRDAGLVERRGRGRFTRYVATGNLRAQISETDD